MQQMTHQSLTGHPIDLKMATNRLGWIEEFTDTPTLSIDKLIKYRKPFQISQAIQILENHNVYQLSLSILLRKSREDEKQT